MQYSHYSGMPCYAYARTITSKNMTLKLKKSFSSFLDLACLSGYKGTCFCQFHYIIELKCI